MSNLRTIRQKHGLSIDEAGLRANVERSRLSRAERGYAKMHPEEFERLAAVYGVKVSALVDKNS